jgi:hypothetical protein
MQETVAKMTKLKRLKGTDLKRYIQQQTVTEIESVFVVTRDAAHSLAWIVQDIAS